MYLTGTGDHIGNSTKFYIRISRKGYIVGGSRKRLGGNGHAEYRCGIPLLGISVHPAVSPAFVRNGFTGKQVETARAFHILYGSLPDSFVTLDPDLHSREPVSEIQRYRIVQNRFRIGRSHEIR